MNAAAIIKRLSREGIQIEVDDGDLLLDAADVTSDLIDYLRAHKAELVAYLRGRELLSLDEALATACSGLTITPEEVHAALALEDVEDWHKGNLSTETLAAFAKSLLQQRDMAAGIVPASYTEKAVCRRCGPVWLWIKGELDGCPWCFHRAAGNPVPRPSHPKS